MLIHLIHKNSIYTKTFKLHKNIAEETEIIVFMPLCRKLTCDEPIRIQNEQQLMIHRK